MKDIDRPTICEVCGEPFHVDGIGRPRRFCSNACRQYSYRKNRLSIESVTKREVDPAGQEGRVGKNTRAN